jgi:hypothetical protein
MRPAAGCVVVLVVVVEGLFIGKGRGRGGYQVPSSNLFEHLQDG